LEHYQKQASYCKVNFDKHKTEKADTQKPELFYIRRATGAMESNFITSL